MIAYILKVTLCWLFFYGIYELFLKKRTFFNANRSYLLSTLCIGIVLPLLEFIPWKTESNIAYVIYPVLMEIDDLQTVVTAQAKEQFNWMNVLYILYAAGVIVSLLKFILGLNKIVDLFKNSEKIINKGYTLVMTEKPHLPFSFFKWVFLSKKMKLKEEVDQIMEHEIEHIKGKHSLDVIVIELLKIVFWCSPMIYFYKNALREVHEYLADNIVVTKRDKVSYKKLLLQQTTNSLQMALTHQFFNSHLKNRLKMISQKRSGRPTLVMYALGIPVLLLLLFAFTYAIDTSDQDQSEVLLTQSDTTWNEDIAKEVYNQIQAKKIIPPDLMQYYNEVDASKMPYVQIEGEDIDLPISNYIKIPGKVGDVMVMEPSKAVEKFGAKAQKGYINFSNIPPFVQDTIPVLIQKEYEIKGEIFKVVEQMPRFPGCEDMDGNDKEKENCAKQKMLEYIYKNVKYPKEAREKGIEGMTVVQFVVTKDGEIANIELLREIGGGAGAEATKVVQSMQNMPAKWIAGHQRGKAVNVKYILPIKFKLQIEVSEVKEEIQQSSPDHQSQESGVQGEIFKVVEQMPRFPGCEDMDGNDKEKENCAKQKMLEYIYSNMKYPKEAREAAVEGMSVLQFVVTKDGGIANVKLLRDLGAGTGDESMKVVQSMQNMTEKWTPGHQRGQAVNVKYTLPIRFKLEGSNDQEEVAEKQNTDKDVIKISSDGVSGTKLEHTRNGEKISIMGDLIQYSDNETKPYIVVDGKPYEKSLQDIDPDQIESVNALKGEKAIKKYGENGKNGVIEVLTKGYHNQLEGKIAGIQLNDNDKPILLRSIAKDNGKQPLFVVDGEEISVPAQEELKPDEIKSVNVVKGDKAIQKYGDKGLNGVVEITTRKHSQDTKKKSVFNGKDVDQMAFFPGCNEITDLTERKNCSNQQLLNFIYTNLKYPKEAAAKGIEGMVVTNFTINSDGRISHIKLLRDVNGLSKEALRVVALMDEQNIVWEPALLDGNPVAMEYTLPIKYKLSDECNDCPKEDNSKGSALDTINNFSGDNDKLELSEFTAFPNPAKDFVNVKFIAEKSPINIQLLSIDGKNLYREDIKDFGGYYEGKLDVKNLDINILILRIQQNGKVFTKKILVE